MPKVTLSERGEKIASSATPPRKDREESPVAPVRNDEGGSLGLAVLKFGGTSVASVATMRRAAAAAAAIARKRPVVVVVSAMAGVTNQLLAAADSALWRRKDEVGAALAALGERHRNVAEVVFSAGTTGMYPPADLENRLHVLTDNLDELAMLLTGIQILGELTPRSLDAIASLGERLSTPLFAAALEREGLAAHPLDARRILVTDAEFGQASPDLAATRARAAAEIAPLLARGAVPVLGGFIGTTADGVTTTLGRGGSDTSAAILGVVLDAAEVQIWTDVDGLLTCDPRLVPDARLIPRISFAQAAELAYFGAKVLHPNSVKIAVDHGVPVRIANTFNPAGTGTLITATGPPDAAPIVAIACRSGVTLISVSSLRMFMTHGFLARVFAVFEKHRTAIDLVSTSHTSTLMSLDDTSRLSEITRELEAFCEMKVYERAAIVCAVGSGFLSRPGIAKQVFDALAGINVRMVTLASDISFSVVVAETEMARAAALLHRNLFTEVSV